MIGSTKRYLNFVIALVIAAFLFALFPPELVVSMLLFAVISYGGVALIRLATSYDSKMKKVDKS